MFSLILVDFNSLPKTLEYIEHCTQIFGAMGTSHIVIVQNGDPSHDVSLLRTAFGPETSISCSAINKKVLAFSSAGREILYCVSGENLGYAKGNNLGVKIAKEVWADEYLIISNNDLVFPEGFDLHRIVGLFSANPKIGAIGPQIVTPEGVVQSPRRFESACSRLIRYYWLPLLARPFGANAVARARTRIYTDTTGEIATGNCDWVSGCLTFLRSNAFLQAGMYDEHTFLYGEEMILSKRLERVGSSVFFCADLIAVHAHGATTKKSIDSLRMIAFDFASIYYFYKEYSSTPRIVLAFAKFCFSTLIIMCKVKATLRAILKK